MSRMHSTAKGKSRSYKPVGVKATWVSMEKHELEMLIMKLAKEGKSSAQIGLVLRDSYGIPNARDILGKKVYEFMKEKKISKLYPDDLRALFTKALAARKHVETNKQDVTAKRGVQLVDSKINRLVKYYKEKGILDVSFKYRPTELNLYLQ